MSRIANKRKTPVPQAGTDYDWRFGGFEPEAWVGLRSQKAMAPRGLRTVSEIASVVAVSEAQPSFMARMVQWATAMLAARSRRRDLKQLLNSDDRMLTDIGLTRGDVEDMIARL